MSSNDAARYRLTPQALGDLEGIWRYTAETWSISQADHHVDDLARMFETIATMPTLARERGEFDPPVRIHPHEGQMIVYTADDGEIIIVRLLGGREDWWSILNAID